MKKFFSNLFSSIFVLVFIAVCVFMTVRSVYQLCAPFVLALGNGSILRGIIFLPLGIFGIVQIVRGVMYIFDHDVEKMESSNINGFFVILYIVSFIPSCFALIQIIRNWPT